jgi:hypothetical protein
LRNLCDSYSTPNFATIESFAEKIRNNSDVTLNKKTTLDISEIKTFFSYYVKPAELDMLLKALRGKFSTTENST